MNCAGERRVVHRPPLPTSQPVEVRLIENPNALVPMPLPERILLPISMSQVEALPSRGGWRCCRIDDLDCAARFDGGSPIGGPPHDWRCRPHR